MTIKSSDIDEERLAKKAKELAEEGIVIYDKNGNLVYPPSNTSADEQK